MSITSRCAANIAACPGPDRRRMATRRVATFPAGTVGRPPRRRPGRWRRAPDCGSCGCACPRPSPTRRSPPGCAAILPRFSTTFVPSSTPDSWPLSRYAGARAAPGRCPTGRPACPGRSTSATTRRVGQIQRSRRSSRRRRPSGTRTCTARDWGCAFRPIRSRSCGFACTSCSTSSPTARSTPTVSAGRCTWGSIPSHRWTKIPTRSRSRGLTDVPDTSTRVRLRRT